jgi:hypothetical protein
MKRKPVIARRSLIKGAMTAAAVIPLVAATATEAATGQPSRVRSERVVVRNHPTTGSGSEGQCRFGAVPGRAGASFDVWNADPRAESI